MHPSIEAALIPEDPAIKFEDVKKINRKLVKEIKSLTANFYFNELVTLINNVVSQMSALSPDNISEPTINAIIKYIDKVNIKAGGIRIKKERQLKEKQTKIAGSLEKLQNAKAPKTKKGQQALFDKQGKVLNDLLAVEKAINEKWINDDYELYKKCIKLCMDVLKKYRLASRNKKAKKRAGYLRKGVAGSLGHILGAGSIAGIGLESLLSKKFYKDSMRKWQRKSAREKWLSAGGVFVKALGAITESPVLLGAGSKISEHSLSLTEERKQARLLYRQLTRTIATKKKRNAKDVIAAKAASKSRQGTMVDKIRAAGGGSFITRGRTNFTVGDNPGGKELVSVIPLGRAGSTRVNGSAIKAAGGVAGLFGGGRVGGAQKAQAENYDQEMVRGIYGILANTHNISNNIEKMSNTLIDINKNISKPINITRPDIIHGEKKGIASIIEQQTFASPSQGGTNFIGDLISKGIAGTIGGIISPFLLKMQGFILSKLTGFAKYAMELLAKTSVGQAAIKGAGAVARGAGAFKLGAKALGGTALKSAARLAPGLGIIASGLITGGMSRAAGEGWGTAIGKGVLSAVGTGIGQLVTGGMGGGVVGGFIGDQLGDAIFGTPAQAAEPVYKAAKGGSRIINKSSWVNVGEAGAEQVTVTPLGGPNAPHPNEEAMRLFKDQKKVFEGQKPLSVVILDDKSKIAKEQQKLVEKTNQEATFQNLTTDNSGTKKPGFLQRAASFLGFGGDGGSTPAGQTGSAKAAVSTLMNAGWTLPQAAGIVGNLQVESGPNMKTNAVGDNGEAFGIAQWHADRRQVFQRVVGIPMEQASFDQQLSFVNWELNNTEKGAGMALRQATTAAQAAAIVDKLYERSSGEALSQRIANAEALMGSQSNPIKAAKGFNGYVTGRTFFETGEAGPEHVQITPSGKGTNSLINNSKSYANEFEASRLKAMATQMDNMKFNNLTGPGNVINNITNVNSDSGTNTIVNITTGDVSSFVSILARSY